MKNSTQIGDYLIQRLYAHGVRHVFGIPGDYVLGFYKRLSQSKLRLINTCDEQGAGFAADAYARVRGFFVGTEEELDQALIAAEKNTDSFSILDVHLDPHDLSPALQRLAKRLGKKVKEVK